MVTEHNFYFSMYLKSSFLISILPFSLTLKVFDFDGNRDLEEKEILTKSLANPIQLERKFRKCSSHRQLQLIYRTLPMCTLCLKMRHWQSHGLQWVSGLRLIFGLLWNSTIGTILEHTHWPSLETGCMYVLKLILSQK